MNKVNKDFVRENIYVLLENAMRGADYEVLQVASGSFDVPVVDKDGEEGFATIKVIVRGKDRQGENYDGYAESEAYADAVARAKEKAEAREKASQEKKAQAEARRLEKEAKAKAKAEKELESPKV
jgi:hypothetical protein